MAKGSGKAKNAAAKDKKRGKAGKKQKGKKKAGTTLRAGISLTAAENLVSGTRTDGELFEALTVTYGNLLHRMNAYLRVAAGEDKDDPRRARALEAGMALGSRLDALSTDFRHGTADGEHCLTGWNWGLKQFQGELERTSERLAFPDEAASERAESQLPAQAEESPERRGD